MNRLIIIFSICLLACQESKVPVKCDRAIGDLFVSDTEMEMGVVNLNKTYQKTIHVYNPREQDVSLRILNERPEISVVRVVDGKEISAEETFVLPQRAQDSLTIRFNGRDTSLYGEYYEAIHFVADGNTLITGISIGGVVIDNFDGVSLEKSPRIVTDKDSLVYHFQQDSAPEEMFVPVRITNEGKVDLVIRKLEATCNCAMPTLKKTVIPPGEEAELIVKVDPQHAIGTMRQQIRLVSNDPSCPLKHIDIKITINP